MSAIQNDEPFISRVESLIKPGEVSKLYFFQGFKRMLPRPVFKWFLERTARKTPLMGFVIEPYSFFLFFRLKDIERAKSMLPPRYQLRKARVFEGDEPDYYLGMGVLKTRASTFWGTRHESYLIAEDTQTGLLSWIFIDILSDTLIAIPSRGVADPNCDRAMFTTSSRGEIHMDIAESRSGRQLKLRCALKGSTSRRPDQDLWVMGNTSIAHSVALAGTREDPFAVIFDPAEVAEALDVPVDQVELEVNTLFPGLAEDRPVKAACFPWAQHYMADSPGCRTAVRNTGDMIEAYHRISRMEGLRTFSTRGIERLFFLGLLAFPLISVVLALMLFNR